MKKNEVSISGEKEAPAFLVIASAFVFCWAPAASLPLYCSKAESAYR